MSAKPCKAIQLAPNYLHSQWEIRDATNFRAANTVREKVAICHTILHCRQTFATGHDVHVGRRRELVSRGYPPRPQPSPRGARPASVPIWLGISLLFEAGGPRTKSC